MEISLLDDRDIASNGSTWLDPVERLNNLAAADQYYRRLIFDGEASRSGERLICLGASFAGPELRSKSHDGSSGMSRAAHDPPQRCVTHGNFRPLRVACATWL